MLATDRFGNPSSAYHCDGSGDYIRVPDSPQLDGMAALTLSAWIQIDDRAREAEVLNKGGIWRHHTRFNSEISKVSVKFPYIDTAPTKVAEIIKENMNHAKYNS